MTLRRRRPRHRAVVELDLGVLDLRDEVPSGRHRGPWRPRRSPRAIDSNTRPRGRHRREAGGRRRAPQTPYETARWVNDVFLAARAQGVRGPT